MIPFRVSDVSSHSIHSLSFWIFLSDQLRINYLSRKRIHFPYFSIQIHTSEAIVSNSSPHCIHPLSALYTPALITTHTETIHTESSFLSTSHSLYSSTSETHIHFCFTQSAHRKCTLGPFLYLVGFYLPTQILLCTHITCTA